MAPSWVSTSISVYTRNTLNLKSGHILLLTIELYTNTYVRSLTAPVTESQQLQDFAIASSFFYRNNFFLTNPNNFSLLLV